MALERPLQAILQEQQEKLFFHDLIQHIESKGFKQQEHHGEEEGRWTERLLHYRYKLPHGYTEIELSTEDEKAYLIIQEYAAGGAIDTIHYLKYKYKDYDTQKILEELEAKCQLAQLL